MIHIWEAPQEGVRLKSYSGTLRGAKTVLRIEIEIDDPRQLGYMLAELMQLDAAQKAEVKKAAAKKPKQLRLPAPSDREGDF